MEIEVNGQKLWMDFDAWKKEKEWMEQKEKEYVEYWLSGQRDINIFGEEGVKEILRKQDLEDHGEAIV